MANHSVADQQRFIIEWFRVWSEYQKEDFTQIVAHKLNPSHFINGLLSDQLKTINASDSENNDNSVRKPSLFTCQVKLFNEWWDSWQQDDRDKLTASLKDSDPNFWTDVQDELSGNRKKDEEFFTTIVNVNNNGNVVEKVVPEGSDEKKTEEPSNGLENNGNENINNDNTSAENSEVTVQEDGAKAVKEQERVRINGSGDGVLVIEEDNDEII